jgi:hypothetical protein
MLSSECFFERSFVSKLKALQEQEKRILLQRFWPTSAINSYGVDETSHGAYLDFIGSELSHIQHHRALFAAQDLDSIFEIIQILRESSDKPCDEVIQTLSSQFLNFDPKAIRRSVELSTRLWLTLNTRSPDISEAVLADQIPVEWNTNISLDTLINNRFTKRAPGQAPKTHRNIEPRHTAAYFVNTCGMRIKWTDDISSHLNFDLERNALTVYRHKICLVNHLDNQQDCPISEDLLGEILDTMNLLFPFGDPATKQLLLKEGQKPVYSLGSCNRSRKLDLTHYQYFGEALEYLIESFNKAPRTWRQLALDRRNKLEWSAFWITVMVAILTVVSIPCNIIQAMYSIKAYHVALAQEGDATARQVL